MLFSSNIFLFLFLPVTLLGYYLLNQKYRNIFLLLMSLGFYAWGEPKFVFVMIGSILFNYILALLVDLFSKDILIKRTIIFICIVGNLSLLFVYKYLDFTIKNINKFGFNLPLKKLALPIGISFFTFQAMSYVIDVYRGDVKVQRKLQNVGLYISLFPQLIAGPIVRYKDVDDQIENRKENFELFSEGVMRFIIGLSKKVILANNLAIVADGVFSMADIDRAASLAWVGAIAYAFQILFDFSGYSDMAIGLGKMFGFKFLENFDYPYISQSVTEYRRRWHMSLAQWFRDYVYFPLGGSRVKTKSRLVFNLFIVWTLTGVWHGASWNFVVWGLLNSSLITFEKLSGYPQRFKYKIGKVFYRIFTMLSMIVGHVIFRALGIKAAIRYLLTMIGLYNNPKTSIEAIFYLKEYWVFLLFSLLISIRVFKNMSIKLNNLSSRPILMTINTFKVIFYVFCFIWTFSFLVLGSHNPFIYFNF